MGDIQIELTQEFMTNGTAAYLSEEIGEDVWWIYMRVEEPSGLRFIVVRPIPGIVPSGYEMIDYLNEQKSEVSDFPRRVVNLANATPGDRLVIATALEIVKDGPESKAGIFAILLLVEEAAYSPVMTNSAYDEFREALKSQGWESDAQHPGVWRWK